MDNQFGRPHFVIIGAMKCATTTLHDQLALQPGLFMSEPKEPNFFSDEAVWERGLGWYRGLFAGAGEGDLCGESSTHYAKLPTHPLAAERLFEHFPRVRLVYVMRDPIDRLVSHYIHEWSRRVIDVPIDEAVRRYSELVDYSRYAMQLGPWIERFGMERVLPVFFERLTRDPQGEFERVCRHIGYSGEPVWDAEAGAKNVSARRMRYGPAMESVLSVGSLRTLRRALLPEALRERIKSRWRMEERPRLSEAARAWCVERLDPDMARLGRMLAVDLSCVSFRDAVLAPADAPRWGGGRLD